MLLVGVPLLVGLGCGLRLSLVPFVCVIAAVLALLFGGWIIGEAPSFMDGAVQAMMVVLLMQIGYAGGLAIRVLTD